MPLKPILSQCCGVCYTGGMNQDVRLHTSQWGTAVSGEPLVQDEYTLSSGVRLSLFPAAEIRLPETSYAGDTFGVALSQFGHLLALSRMHRVAYTVQRLRAQLYEAGLVPVMVEYPSGGWTHWGADVIADWNEEPYRTWRNIHTRESRTVWVDASQVDEIGLVAFGAATIGVDLLETSTKVDGRKQRRYRLSVSVIPNGFSWAQKVHTTDFPIVGGTDALGESTAETYQALPESKLDELMAALSAYDADVFLTQTALTSPKLMSSSKEKYESGAHRARVSYELRSEPVLPEGFEARLFSGLTANPKVSLNFGSDSFWGSRQAEDFDQFCLLLSKRVGIDLALPDLKTTGEREALAEEILSTVQACAPEGVQFAVFLLPAPSAGHYGWGLDQRTVFCRVRISTPAIDKYCCWIESGLSMAVLEEVSGNVFFPEECLEEAADTICRA